MHLVGIGFTPEYWEELVHSIRKQSPDETLVGTLLSTEAVEPEQIEVLGDQISDCAGDRARTGRTQHACKTFARGRTDQRHALPCQ